MGDASLVEMIVIKVSPYLREDRPLLWLGEKEADHPRLLPIAIGEFEAAAIQMPLEGEDPIRPISYDLLSSMLNSLSVDIRQVVIHTVRKSVYYAKVVIENNRRIKDIDSRPSDAVALALRSGAPIYVSRELLDQVGLVPLEDELDIEHTLDRFYKVEPQISAKAETTSTQPPSLPSPVEKQKLLPTTPPGPKVPSPSLADQEVDDLTQLQSKLEQAVVCEEYEEAARLRDEIESLANRSKG